MIEAGSDFEALLVYLKEARGFDFTGYKRSSLTRRVGRRMAQLPVADHAEYLDYLQVHPDEFTALFNTILINVTGFFRDPDAWAALARTVLPALLAEQAERTGPLRVWSAGCASGEEAYSLAMIMADALGPERFRDRVKIYATDVDEEALVTARQGVYTAAELQHVAPERVERYFERGDGRYTFRKDLRRSIVFGRNDLVQDAPIGRIDLLVCRNTLMYFNAETQARIVSRLHFALAPHGALFLGKAEMLLRHGALFTPVDLPQRIFRRAAAACGAAPIPDPPCEDSPSLERLRTEAFLAGPVAQLVVTGEGIVTLANRRAGALLGIGPGDAGRPLRDLALPPRFAGLRGHVERAQDERRALQVDDAGAEEPAYLDVRIDPLPDEPGERPTVLVAVHDVTAARRLQEDLERANRQLEAAYEELQSANEELETTNEELQSTVEELETTNEELQSTNEELETMNEELQSANDELRDRTAELGDANRFMAAVLSSLRAGVIVLDRSMHVLVWNSGASDLWGLRSDETVGRHLLDLDSGLPVERLRPAVREVLAGASPRLESEHPVVDRRGRPVRLRFGCSPLTGEPDGIIGAIVVMEPVPGADSPAPPAPPRSSA
ncbi:CheR family methyltransferase [Dactylosporangium sp. CA-139066]|uniref:CheR family methyltransferase n=1 Tax=Dactylosporangium sp. CA-139066 TaxID=3239930 RepID=UPI003D8A7922